MKKRPLFLQYPWRFPDSPYYKSLVDNPPEGFFFINSQHQKGVITNFKKFWFSNFLKRNIRRIISILKLPIINAHKTKTAEKYDLIHCAHCLSKNKNKPWVTDVEMVSSLLLAHKKSKIRERRAYRLLKSKNCKKIMPWTAYTKDTLIETFPEVKNKIEVVYPAVPLNKKIQNPKSKKITILYATRYFWIKGGYIALESFKKLKENYGDKIDLIFISDVPENLKSRYPSLNISGLVDSKTLKKLYQKSDIFFYPSFVDTFGFGLLEAMSYGLPIISLNTYHTKTRKEILENNKNCLMFDIEDNVARQVIEKKENLKLESRELEIIDNLVKNTTELIENKKLREKLSKNCINIIKDGKFSIKQRNLKLKKIYKEALNEN